MNSCKELPICRRCLKIIEVKLPSRMVTARKADGLPVFCCRLVKADHPPVSEGVRRMLTKLLHFFYVYSFLTLSMNKFFTIFLLLITS